MKTLPILEAPTPSNSLAFVNERKTAKVVEITINQKNLEVRLNLASKGAFWKIHGAIRSAPK